MDGGDLAFNANNSISTTWRRKGNIYYTKPGENEIDLGTGRDCSISTIGNQPLVAMSDNGTLKLKYIGTNKEINIGKGNYLKVTVLPDHQLLCVWEEENAIKTRKI